MKSAVWLFITLLALFYASEFSNAEGVWTARAAASDVVNLDYSPTLYLP